METHRSTLRDDGATPTGGDDRAPRTVVFGFDALDFRYLDRYRDSLENFERLRKGGVEARLQSTFPPWTGSAWPSMYTGVDPSYHGVYDFFHFDGYPDQGELVSRNDVQAPAIWNYLTVLGVPSVVLNVPVTHPAEPIEGVLIPGYLAREETPGYPTGIREEISDAIGAPYRVYSRDENSSDMEKRLAGYLELIDLRKRAAVYLLAEKEWEFALIQVQKTDSVVHNFDDDASIRQVYEATDDLLGAVLDEIEGPVNVIVCSDHGIGPIDGYKIFINELLRGGGYLETTEGDSELSLSTKKAELIGDQSAHEGRESLGNRFLSQVGRSLIRVGLTPDSAYRVAKSLRVPRAAFKWLPNALIQAASKRVDWHRSQAYCGRHTRLGIRINLEGREPHGIVPPSEYERVRSELIDLLEAVETPDGKRAFDFVLPREAIYDGPFLDHAPDVLVCPRDMGHRLSTGLYGSAFVTADGGEHKMDGVFIASGPAFEEGFEVESLSLIDVAPVVMASLGVPVPEQMRGTIPPGLLRGAVEKMRFDDVPFGSGALTDEGSDAEVTERLEDLGYL